ncbi:MAG: Gfo/Idh/MocA family oxidoreductase [Anaerolineae bacterium]|nr:Gfo/Idh/MocA family oxidoreductase [Anaerolineae bacterium]
MSKLKLALIGCGGYAAAYLRALQNHADADLVAVCDVDAAKAEAAARLVGAQPDTDWQAALTTPHLDGAIIATPNHLHAAMTVAAAERGLHVLCEKPMATSLEDAQRMVAACRTAGVALLVGLSARYDAAMAAACQHVASGALGSPYLITNLYHYTLQPAQPGRTWHNDPERMGGGALIQMGIHSLDRVLWFGGSPAARVEAQVRRAGGRWSDNVALCQMVLENDVLGQVEIAGIASAARNTLTVHLTEGELIVESGAVRWYDGTWHETACPRDDVARKVQNFLDVIRGTAEPLCSGDVALPAHEVCFAAYRSSAEQRPLLRRDGAFI